MRTRKAQVVDTLVKFRSVDKYASFGDILPEVRTSSEDQKSVITDILDACCMELIRLFREPVRPTKPILKKLLITCMDELSIARVDSTNREFGYQLGWFLADKVSVNLKKGTEKKIWGYWQVVDEIVKAPIRPRNSAARKENTRPPEPAAKPADASITTFL